jgi:hypothetical protein
MTRSCDVRRSRGGLDLREKCASQTTARLETPPDLLCSHWKFLAGRARCTMEWKYQNPVSRFIGTTRRIGGVFAQSPGMYKKTSNASGYLRLRCCALAGALVAGRARPFAARFSRTCVSATGCARAARELRPSCTRAAPELDRSDAAGQPDRCTSRDDRASFPRRGWVWCAAAGVGA